MVPRLGSGGVVEAAPGAGPVSSESVEFLVSLAARASCLHLSTLSRLEEPAAGGDDLSEAKLIKVAKMEGGWVWLFLTVEVSLSLGSLISGAA